MAEESFAAGLVGIVLDGRYRLDALLGEGGMGAVYRAHHLAMDRKVAVKLLKPHLTTDEVALQRFAREARSTMKVDSDHAVKVLDFGVTPHNDYYMVLEYLDGRTVQRELDVDGPFEPARVVHIAKHALAALGVAHERGLIHRDIKPDNLLLMRVGDDPDYTKVLDFGVAKLMDGAARSTKSALAITQAGMVFGTPEFMSPEQACGQQLDGRSDLYSLAATMFAMLTGCGMYRAKAPIEWLTHHARTPPPHLADGAPALAVYKDLDAVLQRCLAKRREARPQNADDMARLLTSIEGTVRKAGARAALPTMRGPTFSPSSYVAAIDPNATLVPETQPAPVSAAALAKTMLPSDAAVATPSGGLPATTSGLVAGVRGNRRGLWLAIGSLLVAGMIAAAIVVAMKKRDAGPTAPVAKQTDRAGATDASVPVLAIDAAVVVVGTDAAVAGSAASAASEDDAGRGKGNGKAKGPSAVAKLIAEAEEAQRTNNRLRQVMKADAALRADPHNARARFLLADGLIASGDLDLGCKYLRELKKNPTARARASQAGCPGD